MNYACPNCGVIGTNVSCPSHVNYNWGTWNGLPPTIQPQATWMPVPEQSAWSSLYAEIGRLNVLLNERDKEIERLKGLMPPDERGPGFVGQGSWSVFAEKVVAERDALREELAERDREIEWLRRERTVLVAWLRKMITMGSPITQVYLDQMLESLANWELSVPWKEYSDQFGRTLPLQGHHKDCGYGKDGWSLCTCDELKGE